MSPSEVSKLQKSMISLDKKIGILVKSNLKMEKSFSQHVEDDRVAHSKWDDYIIKDEAWKVLAQPSLDLGANLRGWGKVTAYFLATIAGIIGLVAAIIGLVHKFK